jgi:hypothetical protein
LVKRVPEIPAPFLSPIIETMPGVEQSNSDIPRGIGLRTELSLRALAFAKTQGLLYERTDGSVPGVLFGQDETGHHGNFHALAYRKICSNPQWARRLDKVHTAFKRSRVRANWQWKELDCAHSSDALLMSIFCHPDVMASTSVRAILGIESEAKPDFGFKPRTPLHNGKRDNTEIDMRFDQLLVEAKLTESDFQSSRFDLISRYRDLEAVFDLADLPLRNGKHCSYQLIRGTLAAYATGCSFCVFCDARRPDLIEAWYRIMRAVRPFELRYRLKLLTWQELTMVLPDDLQQFLASKYGIHSRGC